MAEVSVPQNKEVGELFQRYGELTWSRNASQMQLQQVEAQLLQLFPIPGVQLQQTPPPR